MCFYFICTENMYSSFRCYCQNCEYRAGCFVKYDRWVVVDPVHDDKRIKKIKGWWKKDKKDDTIKTNLSLIHSKESKIIILN